MLYVLSEQHRKNFRVLSANANIISDAFKAGILDTNSNANLLFFYAAEVGLKYLVNQVNKIPFNHDLGATKQYSVEKNYSHDIPKMVMDLKIPAGRVPNLSKLQHKCVGGHLGSQNFSMQQAHEVWRYGLTMNSTDQVELEAYLAGIVSYLEQEIKV